MLIEVNSETDFVSKNSDFQNFIEDLLKLALNKEYTIDEFFSHNMTMNTP